MKWYFAIVAIMFGLFSLNGCAAKNNVSPKKSLKTWNYYKWNNVVRQGHDYSCGSASLATLGQGYFEDPINEQMVLLAMLEGLDEKALSDRMKNGFSLLDLKKTAKLFGYDVAGAKLRYDAIFKLKGPVIVRLKTGKWEHFAVFKGVHGGRVHLADSSRGNIRIPLFLFYEQWDGTALLLGKPGFGIPEQYKLALDKGQNPRPEEDVVRQFSPAFPR